MCGKGVISIMNKNEEEDDITLELPGAEQEIEDEDDDDFVVEEEIYYMHSGDIIKVF